MPAPLLVFAVGNESRGDDAVAPLLLRQLQAQSFPQADFIEDFQLQVEHVTDLLDRRAVLFIDADMSCAAPCRLERIAAVHDNSYTSHAMTPSALLHTYRQVFQSDAPECFLMRIRGYGFELGEALSPEAAENLACAASRAKEWLLENSAVAGG